MDLTYSDHESGNVEGRTGADIGLILTVRDKGTIWMQRAVLIQAKKVRVEDGKGLPSWEITRDQLNKLTPFGDGAVYWLYGPEDGVTVMPARLVSGLLNDQKATRATLHREKVRTSAKQLSTFLLYDLIGGWIGESSEAAITRAEAFGRRGTGPGFIIRLNVVFGPREEGR